MKLNKEVKILLYGANIWYFGEGMLGPLLAVFTEKLGGSILDVTWAWAIYLIMAGFLYILVGYLTDKYDNTGKIMVLGYGLNTVLSFSYLLVSNTTQLFLVQAGLGIAAALASPTWNTLYAKYADKEHDDYQWGLAGGEGQIITGIAIIIGGYLISFFSFDVLFVVMGSIQLIATIYQSKLLFSVNQSHTSS